MRSRAPEHGPGSARGGRPKDDVRSGPGVAGTPPGRDFGEEPVGGSAAGERAHHFGRIQVEAPGQRTEGGAPAQMPGGAIQRIADEETRKEMRLRILGAVESRMVKARERGMPRLRREREKSEELEDRLFLLKTPSRLYDSLGPQDKWREHIDERHAHHGANVYKKGMHGRKPDPEYNRRMMAGDRYLASTFGRQLNVKDYIELRDRIAPDRHEFGAYPRKGELAIHYDDFLDPKEQLEKEAPRYVERFDPDHEGKKAVVLQTVEHPLEEVEKVLTEHYEGLKGAKSDEDRLRIVTRTHRNLENLHPYVDYNSRTNRLVLNRLLAEQNLAPTLLYNPLDVHRMTSEHWMEQIREGQKRWMKQAKRLETERREKRTSTEDEWQRYEMMAKLYQRGGLQYDPHEKL